MLQRFFTNVLIKAYMYFSHLVIHNDFFIIYIYKMENGRMMLLHSVIIGILLYMFMIFILGKQKFILRINI